MSIPLDDNELTVKAQELASLLPENKQADYHQVLTALLDAKKHLEQDQEELTEELRFHKEDTCRLRERVRRLNAQLERLQEIFRINDQTFITFRCALTLSRQLRNLSELPAIVDQLQKELGVQTITCLLSQDDFNSFVTAGYPCASHQALVDALATLPLDAGQRVYMGPVATLKQPDFFFTAESLTDCPALLSGSCFIAPLIDKYRPESLIGVLAMADPDPCRYTAQKGTDFLEHFCEVLAGDLLHVKIHEELARQRDSDELTGIPNRAYLRRNAPTLLNLADRKGSGAALLFCDLNRFKAVNDIFGHATGDAVLCDVARAMSGRIRAYDMLVRLGGDEFVVLMPDAGQEEALIMADRLRDCVAQVAKDRGLCGNEELSVSIGLALHAPGETIDDLIRKADSAMYVDKRADTIP